MALARCVLRAAFPVSAAADTPYLACLCCGWQCTYANGDVYEGNWFRDQRQGDGVLRLAPDNTLGEAVYTGPFDHDERCGTGECTYAPWALAISVRATHVANFVVCVVGSQLPRRRQVCGPVAGQHAPRHRVHDLRRRHVV